MQRAARIERKTQETGIVLELNLDGTGESSIRTGVGFFDHMLTLFAKHACVDLVVEAEGDLHVDAHHTVEDVGIVLGRAFATALGERKGIRRYGHWTLPMEESLVTAAVDFGGRAMLVFQVDFPNPKIGDFDSELTAEFWQAFANNAAANVHLQLHYGKNGHHIAEAVFKAAARAVRQAVELDPRSPGIPSTKGVL
ncbi:imidazoleglycerol-phosphate dehydratase HisB [Thermopirellula anaerolimosa]